ncbi:MAG: hypothetical protein WA491_13905 [Candidatus Acidiferrum sp.]
MKPSLTTTTTMLGCVLAAGLAWAQSPGIIQNTRSAVSNHATASNQAVGIRKPTPAAAGTQHTPAKPSGTAAAAPPKTPAPSAPALKHSADAKRGHHARRGGAILVGQTPAPAPTPAPEEAPVTANLAAAPEGEAAQTEDQAALTSKNSANGRRDPFISPVVSHTGGSGCSTGKKCLEIGAINLRGVVHAESGFIAVVSNNMNKAYFLRENDPVFNGYVVKITGDSIVFQETLQDRLGKTFTREVVKKITTPAV